ncbi:sugar phosphate isomerase/epimerase family protein [Rhizobium halophytocola]|uniref:Sugar phosphate isomerase/epimerase n=1 Tax=Rhizobium halophytocola TaxID=735519 RepID=A0ABS4DW37_9HYPH|nr:sugar phosphate isomerase/epimerase family protein [Rhizobium halophytocola]MBP1849909.1 sugar phosphate isomerase/epimerase [Rhizobium halophytocola]
MTDLPIVGAALTLDSLDTHRDWLIERQRDLELQDFIDAEILDGDWHPLVTRLRALLDGYQGRMGIHGPFWGFTIASEDPDIRAVVTKRLLQGLEVCEALAATHMVVHSPFTTWSYTNMTKDPGAFEDVIERCHMTLAEAVRRAESIGCNLVLENIEDRDPAHRTLLANSFGSEAVSVSLDTGHAHCAHISHGAPPVDYYVRIAGNRLRHVHLQDVDGYADRHWSLGEGNIRWHSVFEAIADLQSEPRLILELRDHDRIRDSAAYLADLGLAQ